jgi:hypothetical protein
MPELETVPKNKPINTLEVRNSVVTERSCLISFFTHYSDTNRSRLNHIDIVTAISDGQGENASITSHKLYYFSLFVG